MKFKKGDIVVCIDKEGANYLQLYKKYTAFGVFSDGSSVVVKIDDQYPILNTSRFILLTEFRKMKIKKIKDGFQKRG